MCVGGVDIYGNEYETCWCPDNDRDGNPDSSISRISVSCTERQRIECLVNQEDTFDPPDSGIEPRDPDELDGPYDYDSKSTSRLWCDLSKAGPLKTFGDILKDHGARITQKPFEDESQDDIDAVKDSSNYSARAWISPVEERTDKVKASFVDYATTNDFAPIKDDETTHYGTAGTRSKGFGTGAVTDMLEVVSHPERHGELTEQFEYPVEPDEICNFYDPDSWCYAVRPPGPIDLDSLSGGRCNPDTLSDSCRLVVNGSGGPRISGYVPAVAERILGAAGANSSSRVNGALLIAAMYGEGGWIGDGATKLDWTDENVRSWSEPWYARMPNCDDMQTAGQGPFGLLTTYFNNAVAAGGRHPSRIVNIGGGEARVIVSKCNFIDAAYAAAELLSSGTDYNCSLTADQARRALAVYRGGANADPASVPDALVDIAVNCQ
jgi:hypothetical protein